MLLAIWCFRGAKISEKATVSWRKISHNWSFVMLAMFSFSLGRRQRQSAWPFVANISTLRWLATYSCHQLILLRHILGADIETESYILRTIRASTPLTCYGLLERNFLVMLTDFEGVFFFIFIAITDYRNCVMNLKRFIEAINFFPRCNSSPLIIRFSSNREVFPCSSVGALFSYGLSCADEKNWKVF